MTVDRKLVRALLRERRRRESRPEPPPKIDDAELALFSAKKQFEAVQPTSDAALETTRILAAVLRLLATCPSGLVGSLRRTANALERAARAHSDDGRHHILRAEGLRSIVLAELSDGPTASELARIIAALSIHSPGYRVLFPDLAGALPERVKRLEGGIRVAFDIYGRRPPPVLAEAVVIECARACGFKRPSRMFQAEAKRQK